MFNKTVSRLFLFTSLGLLVYMGGCKNSSINEVEDLETVSLYSQTDQLAQTMEYVRGLERYEMNSFRDKVNSGLNRWASGQDQSLVPDWKLANISTSLPDAIRSSEFFSTLDDTRFYSNDADYLQQIFWMKEVATRIAKSNVIFHQEYLFQTARRMADEATLESWSEDSEDLLFEALKLIHPELLDGDENIQVRQLAQAIKLFDWTVRNVHLLETRAWPDATVINEEGLVLDPEPNEFPPLTGTAGPGYTRFTWQVLTYAKGDYLERARVFGGLCNQIGLPMTVLAVPNEEGSSRPYDEWLCGVLIGGKMYLFDPFLGLPIHGENPGAIATLAEVREKPQLLSDLDLSVEESIEKITYQFDPANLDKLIGLLVVPPESLSRRMAETESALTGDIRLNLTIDADALAETIRGANGINEVVLWHAPFSAKLFRDKVADAMVTSGFDQEIASRLRWINDQERYIDAFVQLRTARNCFLQGIFRSDRDNDIRSALSYYYSFMYTNEEISMIERDTLLQRRLGILQDANQSYAEWLAQITYMKQYMSIVRADAAFYLAACNYENDMPPTALKWLSRIRIYDDDLKWSPYLPYYLGRAHESAGNYVEAGSSYASDKSAQKHGSLLRKRWMDRLLQDQENGS